MLGIVVPVYNEKDNIKNLLDTIEKSVKTQKEVICVYDFLEDNTLPVIRSIKNNYSFNIKEQNNNYDRGALNAIKTGFEVCECEVILVTMADLSDDLSVVDKMYQLISEDGFDLVCGSRYMKGGKQYGGGFLKALMSRTAGVSLYYLAGIPTHDVTNSFKMYRKVILDNISIESTGGFEIGMEITVKAFLAGYSITEVPSKWFDRIQGKSNFKMWKWLPHYLHWYFLCFRKRFKMRGIKR